MILSPSKFIYSIFSPYETNESLNLTLIPALNRSSMANFTNESIHFNWEAVDFKRDTLYLKINFSEPLKISPLIVQDLMIVDILPKGEFWLKSEDGDSLDEDYLKLFKKVKPQMRNTEESRKFLESASSANNSIFLICVIVFGLNFLMRGSLNYFFVFIHSM